MAETIKTPYEISIWNEKLVWERRGLQFVYLSKEQYKPGKFFSQTPREGVYGAIPFIIDCGEFNEGQRYYELIPNGEVETADNPDDLALSNTAQQKTQYRVINAFAYKDGDGNSIFEPNVGYYIYKSASNAFIALTQAQRAAGPQEGVIYFTQKKDYDPYAISSYYEEYKLCTIGSNTMTSPTRAVNGKLVSKINGENTFTFTLYHRYWNEYTGTVEINPLTSLLHNERKIKLRIGEANGTCGPNDQCATCTKCQCKWYDLVVKQIQENSEQKTFSYTCKDQFVNELSKSGFEIELDNELENNMGTVETLAENILEGSDWGVSGKSGLKQYTEEPLYEVILNEDITATEMLTGNSKVFSKDSIIHVFYSQLTNQAPQLQFLFSETQEFFADQDMIIDKDQHPNFIVAVPSYNGIVPSWADPDSSHLNICKKYRGMRLVRQAQTKYDKTIGQYVTEYEKGGKTYHGFTKTEFLSPQAVINYMVNPTAFVNTSGWVAEKVNGERPSLSIATYPQYNGKKPGGSSIFDNDIKTYLRIQGIKSSYNRIMNSAIGGHRSTLGTIAKGDQWILRMKYKVGTVDSDYVTPEHKVAFDAKIANYTIDENGGFSPPNTLIQPIFDFSPIEETDLGIANDINEKGELEGKSNYIYMQATATRSVSESELKDYDKRFALCFEFFRASGYDSVYIEDVELFPYVSYTKDSRKYFCVPGGALFSETRVDYYYYEPNSEWADISELEPAVVSKGGPAEGFNQKYQDNGFAKIRSISAKESNRFNLIQDLCEKFECWAKFQVNRDMHTGRIKLGKDVGIWDGLEAYRQQKFITFSEDVGESYNWAGFKYGINSKSITRSLDSAGIVSRMIVKNNANEFAPNGFCSVSRATENPVKENFLINFDHYYRHGLLDLDTVTLDLYTTANGYLGYYAQLQEKNRKRDELVNNLATWLIDIAHYEAQAQTYKASYDAALEEAIEIENYIADLTGSSFEDFIGDFDWEPFSFGYWETAFEEGKVYYQYDRATNEYFRTEHTDPVPGTEYFTNPPYSKWDEDRNFVSQWTKYCHALSVIKQHGPIYLAAEANLKERKKMYDAAQHQLDLLTEEKRALNLRFYKKYARFLQEGSWINEDYYDDNLYYLDALSTLHTSAQPKVSYTINVLDLSMLPGYESYKFELGEKTYVEDVEFFGYSLQTGRPHKEEVVISEITRELDSPEKNVIKVQNYKTQFEDLFQRIAATTQSIEYHTGEYERTSSIVETDGTITAESLDRAINKNTVTLSKAKDQSVVIDEYGITTTCISNPSKMVRIIDGGVFLSNDGGASWRTGVTAAGVNTSVLTAGQINVSDIVITDKDHSSFRWNSQGINAFGRRDDGSYEPAKFVRFDHFGIYGVNGSVYDQFNPEKPGQDNKTGEDRIWNEAQYALTWRGFMLRRQGGDGGQVTISSTDDIMVSAKNDKDELKTRIQIGDISKALAEAKIVDGNAPIYGIYIADKQGAPVMTSMDDGQLWLRQALRVGVSDESTVTIGYGKEETTTIIDENGEEVEQGTGYHEIIYAGKDDNSFIVYDDGRIKATGATITGHIEAKSGKIGNMTIGDVETTVEQSKKLDIQPKMGYNFKVGSIISPEELEFDVVGIGIEVDDNTLLKWTLTDFNGKTYSPPAQTRPIKIPYGLFKTYSSNDTAYLEVKKYGDDQYKALAQIMAMSDGEKGEDAILVVITSSKGNYFRNDIGDTLLTAKLFKGGQEVDIDSNAPYLYNYTWLDSNGKKVGEQKTLPVSARDVEFSMTYTCNVSPKEEK